MPSSRSPGLPRPVRPPGSWELYRAVSLSGFRRYATYRVATASALFTNTVFGFILAYTFMALWSERPGLGGYDQAQALTFVWVGQALIGAVSLLGGGFEEELQERIRSGDVAIDLYRPADLQLWWLATDLGRAAFQTVARGVVPVAVGALAFELALPTDPLVWALFLCALLLAIVVSFALRYLVALSAFWLLDGTGVNMISTLLAIFLSGMLLPLTVFPGVLGELARCLPWASLLQVPADVLLQRRSGGAVVTGLAFQAGWAVLLLLLGRGVQRAAAHRVVVQGG